MGGRKKEKAFFMRVIDELFSDAEVERRKTGVVIAMRKRAQDRYLVKSK